MTIWYLAAVACLGSSSSDSNAGLVAVACLGSSSSHSNTGLAAVACLGSISSHNNTGLAVEAWHGSSSNGLAAVVFININVTSMSFLPPDKRNSSNR